MYITETAIPVPVIKKTMSSKLNRQDIYKVCIFIFTSKDCFMR